MSYSTHPHTHTHIHTHVHTMTGKKSLDHTALAGLASKLDFTTVKLRKTGMVEQMLGDSDNFSASPNPAAGMEYNTTHPVMLLKIKGEKEEGRKEDEVGRERRGEEGKEGERRWEERRKGRGDELSLAVGTEMKKCW